MLSKLSMDLPHYHNLEWRLDIQVGPLPSPHLSLAPPPPLSAPIPLFPYPFLSFLFLFFLFQFNFRNGNSLRADPCAVRWIPSSHFVSTSRMEVCFLSHPVSPPPLFHFLMAPADETNQELLQVDPVNLNHIIQSLEGALSEMKSAYARRIMRNVK